MSIWKIALFGSNTYYEPDANSEVLLSAMTVTDPMTDANWKKYDVIGAPTNYEELGDTEESTGGVAVHSPGQKKMLKLDFVDFLFPSEREKVDELSAILRKQWIYFYKGEYSFTNWKPHSDDACLLCAGTKSVEDEYDDGVTRVTMLLRGLVPKID